VSSGAIGPLNYSDLEVCTKCIKDKQTNIRMFGARWSSGVMNLVYMASVAHSLHLFGMVTCISLLSKTITPVMGTCT